MGVMVSPAPRMTPEEGLGDGHGKVANGEYLHHVGAESYQFRSIGKDCHQVFAEDQDQKSDHSGGSQCNGGSLTGSLLHAVHAMCAHILSGVGRHGSSEREVRHHCKTIHTHDDHVGCDDHLTETVGQRLYDNHGHGKDGLGDAGGESQPDDLQCVFLFHLEMAEFEIKDICHPASSFQKQRIADTACAMTVA